MSAIYLGFRFEVQFLRHDQYLIEVDRARSGAGRMATSATSERIPIPNFDLRFARVSGLSMEFGTTTVKEGGQNINAHRLPERASYPNLELERGLVSWGEEEEERDRGEASLRRSLTMAMESFTFEPMNVLITLLGGDDLPRACWLVYRAYPLRWSLSEFDANEEAVVVESMELAYASWRSISLGSVALEGEC